MNASLSVEDRRVLLRSTEAKSDAADGVDQRIVLTAVDLPANSTDIDINDVGCWIKMQVPYVLQQHGARDCLTGIACQICQQPNLARKHLDSSPAAAGDPRQQINFQI